MSAATTGRKTAAKPKSNSGRASKGVSTFDEMRIRLYETKREKREFNLETGVIKLVDEYTEFLTEKNAGEKPSSNGVMETLAINALKGHTEFQSWRDKNKKETSRTNGSDSFKLNENDADDLLGNLDENKTKATNS